MVCGEHTPRAPTGKPVCLDRHPAWPHDPAVTSANSLELQHVAGVDEPAAPISGIDLVLPAGRSLALLGPPRAGKSSLLRLVAGFGRLGGGRILFNGHDLHRVPPQRRPFALLGAQDALFPHMTVTDNVAYGLKAQRLDRSETSRRVAAALDLVGSRGLERLLPEGLNRGERQKVALARALAIEPLVLLLDDPLGALDPLEQARLMATLASLQRTVGMSLLAATTDGAAAMAFADRIAVLQEGSIVQTGRPDELYELPEHALTARLTGPVNLLTGRSTGRGIEIEGLGELAAQGSVAVGATAALALRPDRIELHLVRPNATALEGRVERLAFAAGGLTAHVALAQRRECLAARIDTRRLASNDLPEGQRVWCTWADDHARLVRL